MAILALSFLRALSFTGAEALLLREGYVKEACVETETASGGRRFRYPYCLYDGGRRLDGISYVEDAVWRPIPNTRTAAQPGSLNKRNGSGPHKNSAGKVPALFDVFPLFKKGDEKEKPPQ